MMERNNRVSSQILKITTIALAIAGAGCNSDGGGAPSVSGQTSVCTGSQETSWTIKPTEIRGHKHIYFDAKDFNFITPDTQITSAELEFTMIGKHHKEINEEILIDVNGIQVFGSGGVRLIKLKKENIDKKSQKNITTKGSNNGNGGNSDSNDNSNANNGNSSSNSGNEQDNPGTPKRYGCSIGKGKLNGADSFPVAVKKIALRKGQVIISLHGENIKVSDVTLQVTVINAGSCATPTPSITPVPTATPSSTPIPAPSTLISSVNPVGTTVSSQSMTIEFSGDQQGLSYQCSLNGSAMALCTSPVVYSSLSNGAHNFKVVATNSSGISDPVGATYSWTIDAVSPSVQISNSASLPSLTNSSLLSFEFTASESSTFECALDGGSYSSCTSPKVFDGLSDGVHQFLVRATDLYGNKGEPATYQWNIDTLAPSTVFVDVSPSEANTNSTSMQFTFAANETASFECSLDNTGYNACNSPLQLSGLNDGSHELKVKAKDLAGNTGLPATYAWNVDTVAPLIQLGNVTPSQGLTSATMVSVEFSSNEPVIFNCSMDESDASPCTSPFSAETMSEGAHTLLITATDISGNVSAEQSVQWVVDHTLPQIAWGKMLPSAGTYINSSTFSAEVTSNERVNLSCSLNGVGLAQYASPVQLNNLTEGTYNLAVQGSDLAGNTGNALTHGFIVDLTAPTVSLSSTVSGSTNKNNNTLNFSANESSSYECSLDNAGFAMCASPMSVSGLAEGAHIFEVRAIDVAGNISAVSSVQWAVDTTVPLVTALSIVVSRTSVTVNWTTNEPTTSMVYWGTGTTTGNATSENMSLVTSHTVVVSPLAPNTIYTVMAAGKDQAGNAYTSTKKQFRTNP